MDYVAVFEIWGLEDFCHVSCVKNKGFLIQHNEFFVQKYERIRYFKELFESLRDCLLNAS